MRKIRTALSVLLILLLLCTSVGCAPQEQQAIYMVTDGQEGYYWENMILGAKAAVYDAGWEIQVVAWEDEPDMKAHINAARESGAGYIVTAFSDERSRANEMMFLDADAPQLIVLGKDTGETWAATRMVFDESQTGTGQQLAKHIGMQSDLLLVVDKAHYNYWDQWEVPMRRTLGNHGSRVLERLYCAGEEDTAYRLCMQALATYGDSIDGIVCSGQMGTHGALRAVKESGLNIPIIGAEFDEVIAQGLSEGIIRASLVHMTYGCGYMGIEKAVHLENDREIESWAAMAAIYVDAENMFDENLLPFLYSIE